MLFFIKSFRIIIFSKENGLFHLMFGHTKYQGTSFSHVERMKMKKRVLIVTQNFYPVIGSAGNRMKNIYELFSEHQIETIVLTTEPAYPNKKMYGNKVFWDQPNLNESHEQIVRIPIHQRRLELQLIGQLFYYLETMIRFVIQLWLWRKQRFDYIYVSSPPIFIVFSVLIGNVFIKSKIILEIRDLWPDSLTGVNR